VCPPIGVESLLLLRRADKNLVDGDMARTRDDEAIASAMSVSASRSIRAKRCSSPVRISGRL